MIIEKEHFKYLSIQRGEVSDHRGDFQKWKAAYEASLQEIYESILPVLPAFQCPNVLDIGSGLGGIDVLLHRHYRGGSFTLLDGMADPPEVKWHNRTFSNSNIAFDFLRKNGMREVSFISPYNFRMNDWARSHKWDLVVSFAAYAFHIHPSDYLIQLTQSCSKDTVLIFEVRRSKRAWLELLIRHFGTPKVLAQRP